jgi:hypothetical protein
MVAEPFAGKAAAVSGGFDPTAGGNLHRQNQDENLPTYAIRPGR